MSRDVMQRLSGKVPGFLGVLVSGVLTIAVVSAAETRYVSDQLIITVRTGKGTQHKVIRTARTGEAVEVLEEDEKYLRVRTEDGTEGWVLAQYITDKTPSHQVIARLEEEIERLRSDLDDLEGSSDGLAKKLTDARSALREKGRELEKTRRELDSVTKRYAKLKEDAAHVIELTEDRDRLKSENETLSTELRIVKRENEDLHRTGMINWFLAGAGVFLVGWITGKISRKKKSYY